MTQHTQPVVASQHQQHHHQQQQQQQQQHQLQTSTPQQQQTTMIPNTNNSNASNNISTTSSSSTNNNQTQTVAIQHQQHLNNNNANNTYQSQQQNATSVQMFNPQLQSTNVYVPTQSMPVHHHPQHHHQPGAMYQTMIPAAIPSNVYVNNVTANVNLHGWAHTVPHGAWVHPSGAPPYIHGDLPQEQGASVIQPMGAMPVTLPAANALAGPVINANATVISGGTRGSRRGRGRGGASGSRRGDYNMQRYPPSEGSPAPQQSGQMNQQDMQQQQQGQQPAEAPQIMTALPPSYVPHPQYAAHASQYPYGYQTYFAPQQHMIHPGQSAAAQQATGTPLYFSHMPVYNGPHMYNYGYYMPPVINQSEYPYGEEVEVGGSLGDERQTVDEGGAILWHQQTMYPDEYGMSPADMHAVASDEINHNPSLVSANETPSMLSPNYQPMYDQITQQMGVMQIYEDPQMGQMQVIHPQAGVPQMEEELSECGSQPSTQMQIVPPIQMVPITSAVPQPTMALPAATSEHIVHQQTPHLIPVTGIATIIPADGTSLTPNTTPQHQINQQHGDNTIDSNLQTYENVSNKQPSESATSLNEEIVQQPADNVTIEYQQQQLQIHTQSVLVEAVQSDDLCNNKILSTDIQEPQESRTKTTRVTEAADNNSTDVAIETVTTNVVSNKQQQPVYQQQQQIQEKHYKQQQQYVAKQQSVPQQQQYQHQQLQTQPMPAQQQQEVQATPQQPQQPTHYQPQHQNQHNQQQQQHHQSQQQTTYENRKSSQMYNQQHQSRGRKYDYHHVHGSSSSNDNSSHQQQQSQQTTKTMSWTNSSQHKKSTNTVAVTATPTSSHSSGSYNKQSNNANLSSSHTHATRTYTNQQHHNYQQQQNYHFQQQQQQQQQPQTRNYGAMKMPSSPISSAPNTMERKTSQSSDVGKAPAQQQQSQTQSTSTASTTAAPHQFQQQQQSQQTSTNDNVQTHTSSSTANTNAATTATAISSKQQHYPPGFATKKHNFSNQGQSGGTPNIATSSTGSSYAVDTPTTPAINLAPPVTNTTPAAPSTPSWASLFASSSNTSSTGISSAAAPINNLSATSTSITASSSTSVAFSKKPVAKVAPYEGLTPVTPPPPVVTPGTLSYSAASAQNLPPPLSNTSTTAATANKSNINEQQLQRNLLANLDEYSLKFAEFLTKYKSDWSNISLRPRGLTNRSNYCYINSILQALLGFSPLYNLIRSIPKQAANFCEVKTPTVNAMITFMSNFSNLPSGLRLRNAKGGKGNKDDLGSDLQCDPAFEPTEIYKLWNDSREEHVEGRQEDAEEFLSYILNKLNDEMLEVIKLIAKPNTEPNNQNEPPEEDGDVWQMICNNRNKGSVTRQTDFGCTPLSDIFRGELRSRLQREGEHPTDVIQPFFTLQLNIEKAASVKEALEILVGRDQLEGVTGSKSKQEVVAWQQMNLEKLPPILILHLKWFDYRSDGCTKILKKVEFPVELKIDAKILASKKYSQKQRAYRLFAVVYHDGKEATKGHYITDVYHTGYGSWLRYDDSSVKPVSENHVLLPRTPRVPYLLCYRRSDTIPQQSNNNQNNSSTGNNNSSGNTQTSSGK